MSVPPLVARARAAASELGFESGHGDEEGRLVHVLAGSRGVTRAAEVGTGAGVGTAWIASALAPGVPLFTTEPDAGLLAAARRLFVDDPDVHVLPGDWHDVLPREAPFDLVVVDGARATDDLDAVLGLVVPGATLVLRGVSPDRVGRDPGRTRWLDHPGVTAVEVDAGGSGGTVVATVRR